MSSHLLAEVERSCTHLVVMDRGRLVRAGPVTEIVGNVLDAVTALGSWREFLPAHWQYAWADAMQPRVRAARRSPARPSGRRRGGTPQ